MSNLNRLINKGARGDRKQRVVNQLQRDPMEPNRKVVNRLQKDDKPAYTRARNSHGRLVPLKERAETIAAYLQEALAQRSRSHKFQNMRSNLF